jgi:hypothetical protein
VLALPQQKALAGEDDVLLAACAMFRPCSMRDESGAPISVNRILIGDGGGGGCLSESHGDDSVLQERGAAAA